MPQADIIRDTNTVYLTGKVTVAPRFVYNQRGYDIYEGMVEVPRLSGTVDRLPFASEAANIDWIKAGDYISIDGHMHHRGKTKFPDIENRLVAFADAARIASPSWQPENAVTLTGHLCRKPSFRVTPRGKASVKFSSPLPTGTAHKNTASASRGGRSLVLCPCWT